MDSCAYKDSRTGFKMKNGGWRRPHARPAHSRHAPSRALEVRDAWPHSQHAPHARLKARDLWSHMQHAPHAPDHPLPRCGHVDHPEVDTWLILELPRHPNHFSDFRGLFDPILTQEDSFLRFWTLSDSLVSFIL